MNDIEQAAYDYVLACRTLKSADECGMPSFVLRTLRAECNAQHENLIAIAEEFFDNHYDGATE